MLLQNATSKGGGNMPNQNKIKGRIVECGTTIGDLSKKMGLSAYQLGKKIAGTAPMTLTEANQIQEMLKISDSDFQEYFFCSGSCKMQQEE